MFEVAEAAVLLCVLYLPGHVTGRYLLRKGDGIAELLLLRALASVAVATPVLVALALAGLFVTPVIVAALLAVALVLRLVLREEGQRARASWWDLPPLGLVAGAFALYGWRVAEYVIDDRDPGVYALVGASLARTGEFVRRDPLVGATVPFHHFTAWTKYPGFYISGDDRIVPQFFPGPPAWLALGNLVGGLRAELLVVPLAGALSVGVLYLLGRELFDGWTGLLGASLLTPSLAQVWWSRHPSSEVLAQLLVLSGLLLAARFLRERRASSGLFAGLLLGGAMLVRVDAFLALAALPFLLGREALLGRPLRPWLPLLAPVALLGGAALLYANTVGGRYLNLIYDRHGLREALALAPFAAVAVVLIGAAIFAALRRWPGWPRRRLAAHGRRLPFALALVLLAAALWSYFVRPEPWGSLPDAVAGFDDYDRQAAVRLVWAATVPVAVLGAVGFLLAARRATGPRLLLLGAVAAFGVMYVAMPNVNPDLPWATRRFVPTVLPGLALLAAYATVEMARGLSRRAGMRVAAIVAGTIAAVMLGFVVRDAASAHAQQELEGTVDGMERLEAEIPDADVVFVEASADDYAATLDYLYGRPVLPYDREDFRREADGLREAGLLKDAVWVSADGRGAPEVAGLRAEEVGGEVLRTPRLSATFKELPTRWHEERAYLRVFELEEER